MTPVRTIISIETLARISTVETHVRLSVVKYGVSLNRRVRRRPYCFRINFINTFKTKPYLHDAHNAYTCKLKLAHTRYDYELSAP